MEKNKRQLTGRVPSKVGAIHLPWKTL